MKPLVRATRFNIPPEILREVKKAYALDKDADALTKLDEIFASTETWINDKYQVEVREIGKQFYHLNIRRRDGKSMTRDWRDMQAIKNQLLGKECEAIELYPAESRLVDTCNKYHLWGSRNPEFRFPIGFLNRDVSYDTSNNHVPGLRQRPLKGNLNG